MTEQNNGPAPLTAEVAQIIGALKDRQASWVNDGSSPDKLCHDAADMLTALATQLSERDAELARMTLIRDDWMGDAKAAWSKYKDATARIAALTEALTETAAILQAAVVVGKVRGGDSYRIGGVYLQTVSDALDAADAALTTDKEPTT